MWPCIHRTRKTIDRRECGHCTIKKEIVRVYGCEKFGQCTIHAKAVRENGRGSPLVAVCISCDFRNK